MEAPKQDPKQGETPQAKRFCIQFRETPRVADGEKAKVKTFHNFFTALDENAAVDQFWHNPTWKGATKKIEIIEVTS